MQESPTPKAIAKALRSVANYRHVHQVFSDFVECAAITLSNALPGAVDREEREARYMRHAEAYKTDGMTKFAQALGDVAMMLETPADVLGEVFNELELGNERTGQFFTPYSVCQLMAKMTIGDDLADRVAERGFVRAHEPAVGAGAMVIALAEAMREEGVNYQQQLHVTAIDVDARAVHMAYIQFSLLHIPAVVYVGNTLSMEMRERWVTPAHVMGGWDYKLHRDAQRAHREEQVAEVPEPRRPEKIEAPGRGEQLGLSLEFGP